MKITTGIFLSLCLLSPLQASTWNLKHILKNAREHSPLTKALHYEKLSLEAKNRADTAGEPFHVAAEGTRAYPIEGEDGMEYAVGLGKKIALPGVLEEERRITQLSNEAEMTEKKRLLLNLENSLKYSYHQHCIDRENYQSFKRSYLEFVKLYKKKEKAYQYQEISRMELVQLETEMNRLKAQLQSLRMKQEISRRKVLILGNIPNSSTTLSCRDTYPIRRTIPLAKSLSLSKEAYEKRLQSTRESIKRYARPLDSVETYGRYSNELDVDKYTVGVLIPLGFTSKRNEEERAAAMYKNSAIRYEYEQQLRQKRSQLMQLRSELKSHALMVEALQKNVHDYTRKLFPLSKKSFELGEISVLEYLINRQRLYQIQQAVYAEKEAYYATLFRLYTVNETKEEQ